MKNIYIQVTVSADSEDLANKILEATLENRLAACGHINSPMQSSYWWQGKIEHSKEWSCVLKTRKDLFPKIEVLIKKLHTYETPEILALPILEISDDYRKWMDKELTD
jgi:periplasmic divalent cation tolerance protein